MDIEIVRHIEHYVYVKKSDVEKTRTNEVNMKAKAEKEMENVSNFPVKCAASTSKALEFNVTSTEPLSSLLNEKFTMSLFEGRRILLVAYWKYNISTPTHTVNAFGHVKELSSFRRKWKKEGKGSHLFRHPPDRPTEHGSAE